VNIGEAFNFSTTSSTYSKRRQLLKMSKRGKFASFGKKEHPGFSSNNRCFIDFITPAVFMDGKSRR